MAYDYHRNKILGDYAEQLIRDQYRQLLVSGPYILDGDTERLETNGGYHSYDFRIESSKGYFYLGDSKCKRHLEQFQGVECRPLNLYFNIFFKHQKDPLFKDFLLFFVDISKHSLYYIGLRSLLEYDLVKVKEEGKLYEKDKIVFISGDFFRHVRRLTEQEVNELRDLSNSK
jgi:hypothetical protein